MKYASIDVGTNTLRLLIAEPGASGLRPILYKRVITRLGGGYSEEKGIDRESAERTIRALEGFKSSIDEHGAGKVLAVATSVVRRAVNRDRFLSEVLERTGLGIKVIGGDEEARFSLLGVLSVVGGGGSGGTHFVVDIGGGSTEFILTRDKEIMGTWSMEMGVVHLTEDHLKSDPPEKAELEAMEAEVGKVISGLKERMTGGLPEAGGAEVLPEGALLVGTAGTITTLAALDQDLPAYDAGKINNYTLTRGAVERMYGRLSQLKLSEREQILSLEKGREDLIIPGSAIVLSVMDSFGLDTMKVSDAGLLEGLILKECPN